MNLLEAQKFADSHLCAKCRGSPSLYYDADQGWIVRCQNPKHQGFIRIPGITEAWRSGQPVPLYIADTLQGKEKRQMTQQHGEATTTKLAPFMGVTRLTQEQASLILRSLWPKAPPEEVFKAALTCKMYGLNPLMKHLYLVPFATKEAIVWAQVLGIGATRLIASRVDRYTYYDGPRMMTEDEQKEINGYVDQDNIWAITIIQDSKGNQAPGYGSWPKDKEPYGTDKGNSRQNMAMIRSERHALDRLFPGEMPQDVEVIDPRYFDDKAIEAQSAPIGQNEQESLFITQAQVNALWAEARKRKYTTDDVHRAISRYGVASVKELTQAQAAELINDLRQGKDILTEAEQTELPL